MEIAAWLLSLWQYSRSASCDWRAFFVFSAAAEVPYASGFLWVYLL
jgi:hypothetical protein